MAEVPTLEKTRNKWCKGSFGTIRGVKLPGGMKIVEAPTVKTDMRKGTVEISYLATPTQYGTEAAAMGYHVADTYHHGRLVLLGQPLCYNTSVFPDFGILMPYMVIPGEKVTVPGMRSPVDEIGLLKSSKDHVKEVVSVAKIRDIYSALFPRNPEIARYVKMNERSIFMYENPLNNPPQAYERLYKLAIQHISDIDNTEEREYLMTLSRKVEDLDEKIRMLGRKGGDLFSQRLEIQREILETVLGYITVDELVNKQPADITDLVLMTGLPYSFFRVVSRFVGYRYMIEMAMDALDRAFNENNPLVFEEAYTIYPSFKDLPENMNPWMHFRHRLTQRTRFEQKKLDSFTTKFNDVTMEFIFDPAFNEALMDNNRGPAISIEIIMDREYLRRPVRDMVFDPQKFKIRVKLPSFIGLGKDLWGKTESEMRILLDTIVVETVEALPEEERMDLYVVTKKKKIKEGKRSRILKIKNYALTYKRLYREARERLYAPEFAQAEGRVSPTGEILPRKADINMRRAFKRAVARYAEDMRRRHLEYRDLEDDEIFVVMDEATKNKIIEEAKKEYFEKICTSWARNLQIYYSQIMSVFTDFMRVYSAGLKSKNTSMYLNEKESFIYKNMIYTLEYAVR